MKMTHDKEVTQSDKEVTQFDRTCPCGFFRKRYMVAMLSFLGFANIYAMRVNLSIAIAVMVANQTVIQDGKEIQVLSNVCCPTYFLKLGVFLRIKTVVGGFSILCRTTFSFALSCNRQITQIMPKRRKTVQQMFMFISTIFTESLNINIKNFFTHSKM